MTSRRVLILAGILLILFLGMYTWNQRTRTLDDIAANIGLELAGSALAPLRSIQDSVAGFWRRYFDIVNTREENERLKTELRNMESRFQAVGEDLAELKRLRELIDLPKYASLRPVGARVIAGRMGPNAVLDSITINRGYVTEARPGTPLVTHNGLVGRVLRASPHTSTVLLLTDQNSRIAVFSQTSRAFGILAGRGPGQNLEVNFVQRDANIKQDEVLLTSGLDKKYPKGIPVARVTSVAPSDYTQFMAVEAESMVDLRHLEEVILLASVDVARPPEAPDHGPIRPMGQPAPPAATAQ
ncbi:rod shape-determining protein MreC [Candidatus Desulfovibrio trichonymphae]|uniref:Cell shape-determining protein MreC n=1 Tax=Candidatus Desulfovibrio trichonymphae TaxID=1725232 RepID=A0A1J1E3W3_9BACT|nr:rod shape-determining protein MreC [Candidatus Desulfovibrio trichonymphae]BAV92144.1 rod shape-determining protein MreC [Candidatus Desulfovibrio trichonymphae]GHU92075.1 cell shape-determining protein MreC [Deltaproteobacteria bacterium]GHU96319.1 cell shape-determining protein MreC [Deltaproteobacteria bacterium]GHU99822.1 cell shape-determining protein MreC [Deltaproteobacteria bacterium]